jgi:hypothetical protein
MHLVPSSKGGQVGGEPVLRGVGEPLLRRRAPGLAHHASGGTSRATGGRSGETGGSCPDRDRGSDDGGSRLDESCGGGGGGDRSSGGRSGGGGRCQPSRVLRRPRPQGPPKSSCCGCPAGRRACGTPAVSPPGPSPCSCSRMGARACARSIRRALQHQPLRELQSTTWRRRKRAREEKESLDREDEGAREWKKPLESSEALKGMRCEKLRWFNARIWIDQMRVASMGHVTDVSCVAPCDGPGNHYGDRRV